LRWRILEIVSERGEASPVELARALDEPLASPDPGVTPGEK
jgi:hypothetical protein